MKIAYVASISSPESGVKKKIDNQIATWKKLGCECRPYFITHPSKHFDGSFDLWPRFNLLNPCLPLISEICKFDPDVIYFRDKTITLFNLSLLINFRHKIIVEINSDYISEAKLIKNRSFSCYREYLTNCAFMPLFYKFIAGMVCVTNEIAKLHFYNACEKKIVIPNSIDLSNSTIIKTVDPGDSRLRLFFIGTPQQQWHGIDKMISMMYFLGDKFHLDIIGSDSSDFSNLISIPNNVTFHGFLPKEKYTSIVSRCHIAISTLALHRNNMNEACPLKSRECLASGFPLIAAYDDPAFEGIKPSFILQLENSENNLSYSYVLDKIKYFCFENKNRIVQHSEIQQFLDSSIVESKRIRFFQEIYKC